MAYVKLPSGIYAPELPATLSISLAYATGLLIDATGEMAAYCGQVVWNDADTSKTITKVGIRFGAVTKAGGSGLTLSLQDVSLTAGAPMRPDETQDQTYAIANGNASFASNTWLHSGALSANRTVNFGDLVSVVLEFDGSGRLGADSVVLAGAIGNSNQVQSLLGSPLKTGGSWAAQAIVPNVIFEFTDGTFGTLAGSLPASAISSHTYNSGSTPDEYALVWQLPFAGKVDGGWFVYNCNSNQDFDIVLYASDGTTTLATKSVDGNTGGGSLRYTEFRFSTEIAFNANTSYYLAVKPTTANNIGLAYFDVNSASYMGTIFGGTNWFQASRTNAGAWTNLTTRRLFGGVHVSSIDTGSGGGGPLVGGRLVN